eukprot:526971-Rhodomonas_salina.1
MPSTDATYGATSLGACYAVPGTDLAYAATRDCFRPCSSPAYRAKFGAAVRNSVNFARNSVNFARNS